MTVKILCLETELQMIECKEVLETTVFSCNQCDYRASSSTVLTCYTTTKGKIISCTPEVERCSRVDDSMKLISPTDERYVPPNNIKDPEPIQDFYS